MKILQILVVVLFAAVALFFAVGVFLPNTSHVERSIDIEASPAVVFPLVGQHKEFQRWSPWFNIDPDMVVTYSGPDVGVGSAMSWTSDNENVGSGSSVFTEYVPNRRAATALDFGQMGTADAYYDIQETDTGVNVTWGFDSTHDNTVARYFGLMLDSMLGPMYEEGLAELKKLAESQPVINTEEVIYEVDGTPLTGFLAYPADADGQVPGVLVVHEWWGHNDYVRKRAKMLARLGYAALALDMYGDGKLATHPDDAGKFAKEVMANAEVAQKRFDAAAQLLGQQPYADADNIAAIGYCFGGSVVMSMARLGKDLKGVVSFHGGLAGLPPVAEGVDARFLVLNGADDPMVTEEQKLAFADQMETAQLQYEFVDYPGVTHSFTNPDADKLAEQFNAPFAYDAEADTDSWARMTEFFQEVFE